MSPSDQLWWANEIRIWGAALAGVAAIITFGATWAQLRLQTVVGAAKDAAAIELRRVTDERIAETRWTAAQAMLEQEKLTASNLQLATTLERERTERLQLEAQLRPRGLTPAQRAAIFNVLSGKFLAIGVTSFSDPEAINYARQLMAAFAMAGSTVELEGTVLSASQPEIGVMVEAGAPSPMHDALREAGIAFSEITTVGPPSSNPKIKVRLLIGLKPDPFASPRE